jgi:hypothetical protein
MAAGLGLGLAAGAPGVAAAAAAREVVKANAVFEEGVVWGFERSTADVPAATARKRTIAPSQEKIFMSRRV